MDHVFLLEDYDYHLPEECIAHYPMGNRDQSKLMVVQRNTGIFSHRRFFELPGLLASNDVLVINNTAVVPGRLFGRKDSGGKAEVLILNFARALKNQENPNTAVCECLVKSSKKPKIGSRIDFAPGFFAIVQGVSEGLYTLLFTGRKNFSETLHEIGHVPLPPYIHRNPEKRSYDDAGAYQTVYASEKGAIAAPTAGLHFTPALMADLAEKGIRTAEITLHVGYGTFLPVRETDIRKHRMHGEWFSISDAAAETINTAGKNGGRIVAVGTTSVRTLEYASDAKGHVTPGEGVCDLYIYPGYRFQCVDAMVTNFHLPKSTLLMLVAAFTGRENILSAYTEAVQNQYRFYSYGDAMFIS